MASQFFCVDELGSIILYRIVYYAPFAFNNRLFAYESVCQLGHSLVNISQLIPALAQLEVKADQQLFVSNSLN